MKKINCLLIASVFIATIASCEKFYSYEGGMLPDNAEGKLQDSLGNCYNIVINGYYIKDSVIIASNNVQIYVNITKPGKYVISTDTINGYWFRDTGSIANTGLQRFTLKGYGIPLSVKSDYFTVHFKSSYCSFTIPLSQSKFNFNAQVGTCPVIKVNGAYKTATALNSSDSVNVPVSVITPGTYIIQTSTANGIVFSSKGIFTNTGSTTITMIGSGVPVVSGSTSIPLTIANKNCSFIVSVTNNVIDTTQFWKFTAEGVNYKGYVDSIYHFTGTLAGHISDTIHSIDFFGLFPDSLAATNSLTFQFDLGRINHAITTGIYHPALVADFKDFYGDIYYFNSITGVSYNISTTLPAFTVTLDTYNLNTRLMHCTFNGPVLNAGGQVINITNGEVKAYLGQ